MNAETVHAAPSQPAQPTSSSPSTPARPSPDSSRLKLFTGLLLMALGGFWLLVSLLPVLGLRPIDWPRLWPVLIIIPGLLCLLPALIAPSVRTALALLYIPGVMLLMLGGLLQYQVISGDWTSWAYGWTVLPISFGLGLTAAGLVGRWDSTFAGLGLVIAALFGLIFALLALIFGSMALRIAAAATMILCGLVVFVRALFRR